MPLFPVDTDEEPLSARIKRGLAGLSSALAGRAGLLRGTAPAEAHVPPLRLFLAELGAVAEPFRIHFRPDLPIRAAAARKVVILLPGFATGPTRMRYMAEQLERAGHKVKRWGLGHNMGPTPETLNLIAARVAAVRERYGQQVVLVGWSLGGVFAREVAKIVPEHVAKVVTMGSPFSHTPYSNHVWRTYQVVAGHRVEAPPIASDLRAKPPVETVAFWSPRDGVISRRAASGVPGERDRAVALRCTHLTFPTSPDCIMALVRELES
ncbi:alpha/beta fold hydrolase [Erythrobacter arachoides]|uniref:Alpha/beta fold hydrolase n=1 Tax=Aurantiacibacter arachoides TaxID=1850444 RepID=A0A845A2Z7_9SPHN|nr:alpha/beta fold hydrolase [Aurantiacibacter arachoides]MXO93792.1 alpha/beta fold hydrolase [Aurantiacibacter arachoides]